MSLPLVGIWWDDGSTIVALAHATNRKRYPWPQSHRQQPGTREGMATRGKETRSYHRG